MNATIHRDGTTDTRKAGRYTVVLTERFVAGQTWHHVALTEGGTFGLEGREVDGWVADYADHDRARAEANRVVCVFRSGCSVEDAALEYEAAQAIAAQESYTYRNVSANDIRTARATMDLFASLSVAQRVYDLAARFAVAA